MSTEYILVIVLVIALVAYFIYKKKKKSTEEKNIISQRKEKDEVWRTIKQYLKQSGQGASEIVNSYVVRRNDVNYVNPSLSKYLKDKKYEENSIRAWQEKIKAAKNKANPVPYQPKPELYVVCFQTKNAKDGKYNPPEAFECEVVKNYISKKQTQQKIVINKKLNFQKEMEWIAPIRTAERKRNEKYEAMKKKMEAKKLAKLEKKNKKKPAQKAAV